MIFREKLDFSLNSTYPSWVVNKVELKGNPVDRVSDRGDLRAPARPLDGLRQVSLDPVGLLLEPEREILLTA